MKRRRCRTFGYARVELEDPNPELTRMELHAAGCGIVRIEIVHRYLESSVAWEQLLDDLRRRDRLVIPSKAGPHLSPSQLDTLANRGVTVSRKK